MLQTVVAAGFVLALIALAWRWLTGSPRPPTVAPRPPAALGSMAAPAPAPRRTATCEPAPAFAAAAAANRASLDTAAWSALGRPEIGWRVYVPLTAREIGAGCGPAEDGFAQALDAWQRAHGLTGGGVMDEPTLKALDLVWLRRRPFVAATAHGACPPPPDPARLGDLQPDETYGAAPIQLRSDALAAYRRMLAAARADLPELRASPKLLTVFSGFRDPALDAVRCAAAGDCGTVTRANCSAHRTGVAVDLDLGAAPGFSPDSAQDANRLYQAQTPVYRWLVANADRFGFANYAFEPWHWEWTGG
ncbi:D-alanyl-D-alanine carboxypeptidase [Caulobacter sp. KR2-114]|uniref:D-alanyl-D-alanine carboxypeptidase n=1 Tax=Caulobacter sp. KR2-114 TaxID=3400912 RepID=UPI003C0127A4